MVQMRRYIASCQSFFERVFTELLLRQPEDPHQFMVESLKNISQFDKNALKDKLSKGEEKRHNIEDPNFDRAGGMIEIVLTLTLNPGDGVREKVLNALVELKTYALSLAACTRFDVCQDPISNEIVCLQQWASQVGLDQYYTSPQFTSATPKFQGLLACPPDSRTLKRLA